MTAPATGLPDIGLLREQLVGHAFPGGTFRIADYEAVLAADAVHAAAGRPDAVHPFWFLVAGLREWGVPLEDMFRLVGATADDGPMLGEVSFEQLRPLRTGRD